VDFVNLARIFNYCVVNLNDKFASSVLTGYQGFFRLQ
jgi:hypothetical protein